MKLKKVVLQYYKSIDKIDIEFETINTIIGRNGSGKTTLLAILAAFLSGRVLKDIHSNFKLILEINININKFELDSLNKKLVANKLQKFATITEKSYIIQYDNSEMNNKNCNVFKKLFGFTAYFSNGSKSMYLSNAETLNWKNTGNYLEVLNLSDSKKVIKNLESFIHSKVYDSESTIPGVTIILDIIDELNSYLNVLDIKNFIQFEPDRGIVFTENKLDFSKLASGEKKIVVLLMYLSSQFKIPGILLIDEPETNLHAEWQVKLVRFIKKISPNTQIIMASHSPLIALSTEASGIKILTRISKTEHLFTNIVVSSDTTAFTVDEILYNVFNIPKIVTSAKEEFADIIKEFQEDKNHYETIARLDKLSYRIDPMSALGIDIEFTKRKLNA